MIHYTPLFTLTFSHGFYSQGQGPVFSVVPLPSSRQAIDNAGLVFRQTEAGMTVLYNAAVLPTSLERLSFALSFQDALFGNYTNLPAMKPNQVIYVSNAAVTSGALSKAEAVGPSDIYTLCGTSYSVDNGTSKTAPVLKNAEGLTVAATTQFGATYTYTQLKGCYTLTTGEQTQNLYATAELKQNPLLTVIDLMLPSTADAAGAAYSVSWEARSMPWQYCIVNASGKSSPTLSITTNDRSVSFVEQASAKVQVGNYPAQVFQSSEPLLMQALPTYQFSLNQTPKHQDPVCLVNALPLPGARQVHQSASGYVSSVNVYI